MGLNPGVMSAAIKLGGSQYRSGILSRNKLLEQSEAPSNIATISMLCSGKSVVVAEKQSKRLFKNIKEPCLPRTVPSGKMHHNQCSANR